MSKRTIYITSAAELSVEHNQLHIKTEQQEDCLRSIEDLGAVAVDRDFPPELLQFVSLGR